MTRAGRIAITRPVGRSRALAGALAARGLVPVEVPLIEIRSRADRASLRSALSEVPPLLIVLSSARAVPALAEGGGVPAGVMVAAVGPSTAAALNHAGIDVAVVGDGAGGAALAARLGAPAQVGDRALLLTAADGRRELALALAAAGWQVEEVVVYETVARTLGPEEIAALAACDVLCFASPSAVSAFDALRDSDGAPLERRPTAVIGHTTAAAARAAGFAVIVADEPSDIAMAAAASAAVDLVHGS